MMKKTFSLLLALLICFSCFLGGISVSAEETYIDSAESNFDFAVKTAEIIKNDNSKAMLRIIGKIRPGAANIDFSDASDCVVSDDGRFVLQFETESELISCLKSLQNNPNVIYAERDMPIYTEALEKGTDSLSWGVQAIEADVYSQKIAPSSVSGRSVTVAIVDSGCEDVEFIKDKLVPGYDFFENDKDAFQDESPNSHGTFLASIVADCTRNLPVKIMPVRVLDIEDGSLINIINGIIYAADNGADVINLSLCAVLYKCTALEEAINYANNKGITVVVCAGNSESDTKDFCPSHCENVLTVASVNEDLIFSERFSNFGNEVDLAAPGENVTGYDASGKLKILNGTSLSTAFVSAAAAMFIFDNPSCNTEQVRNTLTSNAQDLGISGKDIYFGWGFLKLGNIPKSAKIPVETIKFLQSSYELFVGDSLEIIPTLSPDNATDKSFTLSANNGNVSVNGNIVTAVSAGVTLITVTSNNGMQDTAEITITENPPEITATLKINNNPGTKTINYGETLRLTADIENEPKNPVVLWYVDGVKSGEGKTFEVSHKSGSVEVTAKLVDSDGNVLKDKYGNEISDSQTVSVKSGFFQKLISFFKNLFKINRTVIQTVITKK